MKCITLIGMPGAGKSAIGEMLAKRLRYRFIDVDSIIEKRAALISQKIINKFGDAEFLKLEREAVLSLGEIENAVIAPGGSVIYIPEAMEFLRAHSTIIFLDVPLEIIRARIKNEIESETRGIIGLKTKSIEEIYHERLPLYQKYADITIKIARSDNKKNVLEKIMENLQLVKK